MPPAAILSARTESMEKDAPKGGPFGIPTNLGCLLLWFFSSGQCFPETVKNPTGFFGPLFVRCTSCPISRRLPRSDNGSTAYSVRRWEQSEPDGGGKAPPRERTTGGSSCPLWVYKGPCPLLVLSPISVHTEMGPSGAPYPAGQRKNRPEGGSKKSRGFRPGFFPAFQSRSARSISVTSTSSSTPFRNTVRVTVSPAENWFFTALNSSMVDTSAPSMAVIMSPTWMPWR